MTALIFYCFSYYNQRPQKHFSVVFRYATLHCESRSLDFIGENIGLASHARVGLVVVVTLRKISGDVMRQQRKLREKPFFLLFVSLDDDDDDDVDATFKPCNTRRTYVVCYCDGMGFKLVTLASWYLEGRIIYKTASQCDS